MAKNNYYVRVWDSFFMDFVGEYGPYASEVDAIGVATSLDADIDDETIEYQVHIETLGLGESQMIGYVEDGTFVECFC